MKSLGKLTLMAVIVVGVFGARPAFSYGPTDLAHLHPGSPTRPPIGWIQFCNQYPKDCVAPKVADKRVVLTPVRWRELDMVNKSFNRSIKPVTDQEQYGVAEYWTYAVTGSGDCEEYVLEKRRRLIQLGWSPASLLISVVIDKQNGGHAVLTAVTDQGEFVLDNITDDIVPWSKSGLMFVKRQSPSDPNIWVDLGRVLGTPEVITAATRR